MNKTLLAFSGALALALGTIAAGPARACDDHDKKGKADCACPHGDKKATHAAKTGKTGKTAEKVALEGTIVTFGCEMQAAQKECTGAALVVGEDKHLIKKAAKGSELVGKTRDSNKLVKVTGTKSGHFLTVSTYEIKG